MIKKSKIIIANLILAGVLMTVFGLATLRTGSQGQGVVLAATTQSSDPCHPENWDPAGVKLTPKELSSCNACNSYNGTDEAKLNSQAKACLQKNQLVTDINIIVDALAALVGLVCVAMIILGGIQYSLARNNPQAISSARGRIMNAGIALIAFMFMWALLQYLIPGGAF